MTKNVKIAGGRSEQMPEAMAIALVREQFDAARRGHELIACQIAREVQAVERQILAGNIVSAFRFDDTSLPVADQVSRFAGLIWKRLVNTRRFGTNPPNEPVWGTSSDQWDQVEVVAFLVGSPIYRPTAEWLHTKEQMRAAYPAIVEDYEFDLAASDQPE